MGNDEEAAGHGGNGKEQDEPGDWAMHSGRAPL
jgi:hypothetical protein